MYGSRRTNYDPGIPLGTPVELLEEPINGSTEPEFFDYEGAPNWQASAIEGQQPQQQPQQMGLEPVDELEREMMDFGQQYPSMPVSQMHMGNGVADMRSQIRIPNQLQMTSQQLHNAQLQKQYLRNQQIQERQHPRIQRNSQDNVMGPLNPHLATAMPPQMPQHMPQQIAGIDSHLLHHMRIGSPQIAGPHRSHSASSLSMNSSIPTPMMVSHEPSPAAIQLPVDDPESVNPENEELRRCRMRYKPRSSIPPDLGSFIYASQCIAAAESSRLPPFSLSLGEFNHLRNRLPYIHITTYLNIRNGILRLWLTNPLISVTLVEAVGCSKEARYFRLAEFAFEWLVRNGYINQGCCSHRSLSSKNSINELPQFSLRRRKQRQTIVIVGAGIAGLSCARQLENLFERFSYQILADYEDLPRVLVLEGRKRIGGRIYSPMLRSEKLNVDLGGDTIMGFGGGNPLGVLLRRQLGIPVVSIDTVGADNKLFDGKTGDPVGAQVDYRAHEVFKHLLDRMRNFEMGNGGMIQTQANAPGIKSLILAGQDPPVDIEAEKTTISAHEENLGRQYPGPDSDDSGNEEESPEIKVELDFLKSLGFSTKTPLKEDKVISMHAEQTDRGASLGLTMRQLIQNLSNLTELTSKDREALNWYFAKFEYLIGDDIDRASLSSWSHHRSNRFTGRHSWTRDGMYSLARGLDTIPSKLDIRFKTVVNVIEYEDESAQIMLENGEQISADRVIVTAPLGCLKKRTMQFIPDLPQWKMDSIDRLEFGVVNKVVLLFDQIFWDNDVPSIIRVASGEDDKHRGDCFIFQNHSKRQDPNGKALIVGLISGESAKSMASKSDFEIVEPAVEKLRKVFKNNPHAQSAKLVESVVTRWQMDRFTRGAFSHVGTEGTTTDHDLLARPVLSSLFFAGEATSRMYPGTIHGAYISGLRAAKEVLNSIVGGIELPENLFVEDIEEFTKRSWDSVRKSNAPEATTGDPQNHFQGNGNFQNGYQPYGVSRKGTQSRAPSPGSDIVNNIPGSNFATPPVPEIIDGNGVMVGSATGQPGSAPNGPKRRVPTPETFPTFEQMDINKAEAELVDLRKRRSNLEKEHLKRDMLHEIGPEPIKPERQGTTNPFLLFQKDYWDICRQETEASKRNDKKSGVFHASRNEIRASLGKKWRSLPEEQRAPYIESSRQAKVENEERQEAYKRKLKWYESEAANFRQQWVQDHQSNPSLRERYLEEQLDGYRPRKKRTRLTE